MKLSKFTIFLSLICFIAAGYLYYRELQFLDKTESVAGVVKTYRISEDIESGGSSYCPLIEFTTKSGQTVTLDTHICSDPAPREVGEQVMVLYDPDNIEKHQTDDFWGKYVWPFAAAGVGVFFIPLELFNLGIQSLIQKMRNRLGMGT